MSSFISDCIFKIREKVPQSAINSFFHLPLALFSNLFFGFPARKMKIIGVTGTDGKTTTVSLIHHILTSAGRKTAMVSTVLAKIGAEEIDTGFHVTAPNPWLLQKLLRKMVDKKVEYAVLEATSHGLDQFRLFGIDFEISVLTNITHEHLDYHKTFENYRRAKTRLLQKSKTVVLNKDDESYGFIEKILSNKDIRILSYGIAKEADFTKANFPFKTRLLGEYNLSNCLAAIAVCSLLDIPREKIVEAVADFKGVRGRLEEIEEGQSFRVIIDFAHTPNALNQVLKTLKPLLNSGSKLIAVFGAAGLRDKGKRPTMGEIAGKTADVSVITAEDPRTEDVSQICRQIAEGALKSGAEEVDATKDIAKHTEFVEGKNKFFIIQDRQEAISFAVGLAGKGDIVVICGKGHEQSMCFGTTEYPWSEHAAVRKALKERTK